MIGIRWRLAGLRRPSRAVRAAAEQRLAGLGGSADGCDVLGGVADEPAGSARRYRMVRARRKGLAVEGESGWLCAVRTAVRARTAVRIVPSRRAVLGVAMVAIVTASFTGWRVVVARAHADPVPATALAGAPPLAGSSSAPTSNSAGSVSAGPSSAGSASGSASGSAAQVVVDVVGKVRRPGLVRLPAGARVDDAVRAAGGALPGTNLTSLNLARVLVDGEQIAVGVPAAAPSAPAGGSSGGASGASPGAVIDLNTATEQQLESLPGVGPVLAQRIIDWRTQHGRFASVDELRQVSGIGDAKFAEIRPLVSV